METQYTPGPWMKKDAPITILYDGAQMLVYPIIADNGELVALCPVQFSKETEDANISVITAAPDLQKAEPWLLEALKGALRVHFEIDKRPSEHWTSIARAVIDEIELRES